MTGRRRLIERPADHKMASRMPVTYEAGREFRQPGQCHEHDTRQQQAPDSGRDVRRHTVQCRSRQGNDRQRDPQSTQDEPQQPIGGSGKCWS